jgi:hypothetical protein
MLRQGALVRRHDIPAPILQKPDVDDLDDELVAGQRARNCDRAGHEMRTLAANGAVQHGLVFGQDRKTAVRRRKLLGIGRQRREVDDIAGIDGDDCRQSRVEDAAMHGADAGSQSVNPLHAIESLLGSELSRAHSLTRCALTAKRAPYSLRARSALDLRQLAARLRHLLLGSTGRSEARPKKWLCIVSKSHSSPRTRRYASRSLWGRLTMQSGRGSQRLSPGAAKTLSRKPGFATIAGDTEPNSSVTIACAGVLTKLLDARAPKN